jgi:regulation of enolase protein 1 (concanavalin A-like superfamily)
MNCADGSRKWVKTGVEFVDGKPHVSTVAKDNWADWSLLPIPSGGQAATIEMAREAGTLWIYLVEGIRREPIREVTWVFQEESTTECWIGVYAAKPSAEGEDLEAIFEQLEIDLSR